MSETKKRNPLLIAAAIICFIGISMMLANKLMNIDLPILEYGPMVNGLGVILFVISLNQKKKA